ncbi:Protein sco1, putative [Ricinus communis]|uniref:Protein sco1, putative n=1 Tax=Ricinus communis TaxID=3988 RepID=B9T1I6_RICCO|nr:Protein sco1, putative [Ricinus communis]
MAITALTRNANLFRNAHRAIYSRILGQSPPLPPPPSVLQNRKLSLLPVIPVGVGVHSLPIYQRFLSSTTASTITSESSSESGNAESDGTENSGDSQQGKPVRGGPVSWLKINKASEAVKEGPSAGKAAIGGPFNLINHDGKNVTEKDFMGKWTILYFGFTHCPDICPDELQKLVAAIDKIKEKAGLEVVPVFISVDPERDTVEQVREYVQEFHPKLVGLTGNPEEIKKAARAYRVYYMKTTEEDSDYLVDHSIVMYLMGPNMDYVKFFGKNNDVDSLTDGVIKEIKQYKSKK